jgi:protein TonB
MRFWVVDDEREWGLPPITIDRPVKPDQPPPPPKLLPKVIPPPLTPPEEGAAKTETDIPLPPQQPTVTTAGNGGGFVAPRVTPADFSVLPDGAAFSRYYPRRALERGKQGRVELRCSVNAAGRLVACLVLNEEPGGWGFGDTSIRLAQREFQVRPQTVDGQPTDGGSVTFPISWRLPRN